MRVKFHFEVKYCPRRRSIERHPLVSQLLGSSYKIFVSHNLSTIFIPGDPADGLRQPNRHDRAARLRGTQQVTGTAPHV